MSTSAPARFLTSFAQALATMSLYADGHPARDRTATVAYHRLMHLMGEHERPAFSFIDSQVIYGETPLRDLRDWDWGTRLAAVGIERLEFLGQVPRDEFEGFLGEVYWRTTAGASDEVAARPSTFATIKFGLIGVRGDAALAQLARDEIVRPVTPSFTLQEEAETVRYIHGEVQRGRPLPAAEAEAVVASLSVVMHTDSEILLPLLKLKAYDQYVASHSLNVSVLAMGLAEFRGLLPRDVRAIGVAGLLHDLGMLHVPTAILTKPTAPTEREWEIIREHPTHGARIILASEPQVDVAAVVAYEHHVLQNGAGYPALHYAREVHYASRLVQICDRYDSLRTRRPWRDMWSPQRALEYVEERAGTEFDGDMARSFVAMIRQWDGRMVAVEETTPVRKNNE